MRCPFCGSLDSRVIDSRSSKSQTAIRRRRECSRCKHRFTTYERRGELFVVVKRDGRRELFDRQKILNGITRACEKRPISAEKIEELVDEIEKMLQERLQGEVSSREIGKMVMEKLNELDEVAYIRFASVYRQFKEVTDFMREISELRVTPTKK
ncbi:transcriptional repressor NrdR [candidate division NPL-UPA2 bacterium Unc8]|uniref:Transcriptional repressor NrdR n=1 Tax=candidate division NPL-UPA2 bacterium Unc8 TaxID=1980939 RepID=A0A399FVS2_UNCN2|nr:MAG: transcriptional repressor NrdR [candidate division NPL-UPA2 bacterium Unc8]